MCFEVPGSKLERKLKRRSPKNQFAARERKARQRFLFLEAAFPVLDRPFTEMHG